MDDQTDSPNADALRRIIDQARTRGIDMPELFRLLHAAVELLPTGVYAKDAQGRYLYLNSAAAGLLGRAVADLIGRTDEEVLDAEVASLLRLGDRAAFAQAHALHREERLGGRDLLSSRAQVPAAASGAGLAGVWTDVSELRQMRGQVRHALGQLEQQQRQNEDLRQELKDQAVRDPLTGLYNRVHFEEQLRREIDLSLREHREFALVAVQLDNYAELLATPGKHAAERCLQALGRLMRGNTRAMDAPCRLGEDQFAVLLSGIGLATAHARMESVRRQCEAQIVMLEGQEIRFTVSMGVASFPHTSEDRESLLAAACQALVAAHQRGNNCVMLASIPFEPGN
jgi:diguanylate cyclase (GGDEF)-like protein